MDGLHRIRHYGPFANGGREDNLAKARMLMAGPVTETVTEQAATAAASDTLPHPCPCCGGRMRIIETFERGCQPRHRPTPPVIAIGFDTS